MGGPGELQVDQANASIVFRRRLAHPIQEVWAAVTEPGQLSEWFMTTVRREETRGGSLVMEHPNGVRASGRVLEWRPPRVYEYEWNVEPGPNLPNGEAAIVRWELAPCEEGTLLVLTHLKLTRPTAETFERGLRVFLDRLAAHLDGTPLPHPPWVARPARRGNAT